jgi:SAM-dependent methyltransferase
MTAAAFDVVASRYDEIWTNALSGRLQREAVWRHIEPLYQPGAHILDLGCGTGEDAQRFLGSGCAVTAIDGSPEMVRIARQRGIPARVMRIQDLETLTGTYDGAISNFGALNCIPNPEVLRMPLARLVRRGGTLAICVFGRFCLRETLYYLMRRQARKAARRWTGSAFSASLGIPVFYPTVRRIRRALAPDFVLSRVAGIGLCVPPSYVEGLSEKQLARFDAIDRHLAHRPFARMLADHRLLIFVRR